MPLLNKQLLYQTLAAEDVRVGREVHSNSEKVNAVKNVYTSGHHTLVLLSFINNIHEKITQF